MTYTPADLLAAAAREADIYGQTRIPAMLRAGAEAMRECERLRTLVRRVIDDPHWRTCDNTLWPDLCTALQEKPHG